MTERSLPAVLTEALFYAPIGMSEKVRTDYDALVAAGRQRVQAARWVGEMAVHLARQKAPSWISGVIEQTAAPIVGGITDAVSSLLGRPGRPGEQVVERAHEHHVSDVGRAREQAAAEEPFDGYDSLAAVQIVRLLDRLPDSERAMVRAYETNHRGRRTILARLEQLAS